MLGLVSPWAFDGSLRQKFRLWRQVQFAQRHTALYREKLKEQSRRFERSAFALEFAPGGIGHAIDACTMIDTEKGYVYCRVPKAATSTVLRSIQVAETGTEDYDRDSILFLKKGRYRRPTDLDEAEARGIRDYFRFTFVRNPYTRTVSAYRGLVVPTTKRRLLHRRDVAVFLKKGPLDAISLPEFLDFLEHGDGLFMNRHWARQVDIIGFKPEQMPFIGKVETIATDLPHVMERILGAASEVHDWRPHKTGADRASADLDARSKERIARLFREDFETFGYSTA